MYTSSFEAYKDLVVTNKLTKKEASVLKTIMDYPFSLSVKEIRMVLPMHELDIEDCIKSLDSKGLIQKDFVKSEGQTWKIAYDIAL